MLDPSAIARRLRLALDMYEIGETMVRQRLGREHPDADDRVIEELVRAWLHDRPGGSAGDAVGQPGAWPRRR